MIAGALLAALVCAAVGCGFQRGTAPATPATVLPPVVKECAQVVEANFVELVNYTAASDDWPAGLESLVTQTSLCAVRAAAEQLIQEYAGIKMQPSNVDVPGRLKVWLQDHPNTVPG